MIRYVVAASLLAACGASPPAPAATPAPTPAPVAAAVPSSTATAAAPRRNPRLTDPRWLLAAGEDPLEKARLATSVGAAELLDGVADGGETAAVALGALPYADDADVALGRLAELARADAGARRRVLVAILGIAGRPRRAQEPLDPEGARRCADVLVALAADRTLPREDRALSASAARALAEKGILDPARAKIPSDLDPTRGSLDR
jgi:hypothetical protein